MIAIIDFGAGNLRSIQRALEASGADVVITDDPEVVLRADRVVLPGDGNAKSAMAYLHEKHLSDATLAVANEGKPFLGVCVGMQLLFGAQEEGPTQGLGLLEGKVRLLPQGVKVPQMGWNIVEFRPGTPLAHLGHSYFYFVHSYAPDADDDRDIVGETDYGVRFPSVVIRDNIWGTQFHPEKSGKDGLALLQSWLAWQP